MNANLCHYSQKTFGNAPSQLDMGGVISLIKSSLKKIRRLTRASSNSVKVVLVRCNWFLAKNPYAVCCHSLKNLGVKIIWCGDVYSVQLTHRNHLTPVRKSSQPRYLRKSVQPLLFYISKPDQPGVRREFESRYKIVRSDPSCPDDSPAQWLCTQCKKGSGDRQSWVQG